MKLVAMTPPPTPPHKGEGRASGAGNATFPARRPLRNRRLPSPLWGGVGGGVATLPNAMSHPLWRGAEEGVLHA